MKRATNASIRRDLALTFLRTRFARGDSSVRSRDLAWGLDLSIATASRTIKRLAELGEIETERKKFYHRVSIRDGLFGGETSARHWENIVIRVSRAT